MVRPSRLVPFSLLMACSASSGVAISTNPKPRERPVSRSVTTTADSTLPVSANSSRSRSLEVEKERPPTKSFCAMRAPPCFRLTLARPRTRKMHRRRGLMWDDGLPNEPATNPDTGRVPEGSDHCHRGEVVVLYCPDPRRPALPHALVVPLVAVVLTETSVLA